MIRDKRWLVVNFRPGTGGKFLCACFMAIDKVAHWVPEVDKNPSLWDNWIKGLWSNPHDWMFNEPLHDWNLRFFSRQYDRGLQLSRDEFYSQIASVGSDYINELLQSDKIILDFYHRTQLPIWWEHAHHIKLDKGSDELWYSMLSSKNYQWDEKSKTGIIAADRPQKLQNDSNYPNQWEYTNFTSKREWLSYVTKHDSRLNFTINSPDITLDQLLNLSEVLSFVEKIADSLNSDFKPTLVTTLHNHWINQNKLAEKQYKT
jgi:hypothetical protein